MSLKKYIRIFITVFLLVIGLFVGFNVVTDPFGVFGDLVMKWYDYDMTMNPRVAKIGYLDRHYGEYDSYILGSSKASSISVEDLNKYMDASFYNMTWYGGDLKDEEQLAVFSCLTAIAPSREKKPKPAKRIRRSSMPPTISRSITT